MSNFLSVAVVTEAFRQVLADAINASGVSGASATAARPTSSGNGQGHPPGAGVNLFLYQVTPNGAFRNMDVPTRRSDGSLSQPTRSAYDLHYLLTFYGSEASYEPQRILGSVLRALHAVPVITRKRLESVKLAFPFFSTANVEAEPETVKLTLTPLNLEELSKLWSVFFQTTYNLSLAFQASVVIIDGAEVASPALPVASRNIAVGLFRQPLIEQVLTQKPSGGGALEAQQIVMGDTLVLRGKQLQGDETRVRFGGLVVAPLETSDTQVKFVLGAPALPVNSLRAGVQAVQVEQTIKMGTSESEYSRSASNVAAFVLHPVVTASAASVSKHVEEGVTFCTSDVTLDFLPVVGVNQRVVLLLNEFDPPSTRPARAYRFDVPFPLPDSTPAQPGRGRRAQDPAPSSAEFTSKMVSRVVDVAAGTYLVRVQVDGAESLLGLDPANPVFSGPKVKIS